MQTQSIITDQAAVDSFFEELGMAGLSEEKKRELLDKINKVMLKKVFLATDDRLDADGQKQLDDLLASKPDPKEVEKFLLEKIPDYNEMVRGIAAEYKEELKKSITS